MHNVTVIFDLDHTLLDTEALKGALAADGVAWDEGGEPSPAMLLHAGQSWRHLFDGARELLASLRAQPGVRLLLLTFGAHEWQLAKVRGAGLEELFDHIIVTGGAKADLLPQLVAADGGMTVIVNDNCAEISQMRAVAPQCVYILKRGPKGLEPDLGLPVAESVHDVSRAIESATGMRLRHVA